MSRQPFIGKCKSISDYKIESKLGEGTYGAVSLAREKSTGEWVALKKLRLSVETKEGDMASESMQGLPISSLREIQLLRGLVTNENVVKVLDVAVGRRLGMYENQMAVDVVWKCTCSDLVLTHFR